MDLGDRIDHEEVQVLSYIGVGADHPAADVTSRVAYG